MQFKVDRKVLQEVLNYLSTKPFSEVQGLIRAIQENAKAEPEQEAPKAEQQPQQQEQAAQ